MLTAIILTRNESIHIARCIASVQSFASRVVVVDSGSTDDTRDRARALGADVREHAWVNHAVQFNWALDHAAIDTPWVFRIDADEYATPALANAVPRALLGATDDVAGFTVNRLIQFAGRPLRHGAIYPRRMLRVFRAKRGRVEERWMDEHIRVTGRVEHIDADLVDDNRHGLTFWTAKHNSYASREVADILLTLEDSDSEATANLQARLIRFGKRHIYGRLPLGVRPIPYFLYRYLLRGGFLDGPEGLAFHALQGLWYRFLVDAKLEETRRLMAREGLSAAEALERLHGVHVPTEHAPSDDQ